MPLEKKWQFELEEYIRQGEPDRAEKSEAWQTAIGLQDVDGLIRKKHNKKYNQESGEYICST